MFSFSSVSDNQKGIVGVGLRHEHYDDALITPASIDFIEVHAENFIADGGITRSLLRDIGQLYQISLHATSLGLGSVVPAPREQVESIKKLVDQTRPILLSYHACFAWASIGEVAHHAGDLLPIPFNNESLAVMTHNIQRAQEIIGRNLLVENLSAYLTCKGSIYSEFEFLSKVCENTGCGLLLDINNLLVNAINSGVDEPERQVEHWLEQLPADFIGEIHLAGCTPVAKGEVMIDDHSQPVSESLWSLYRFALTKFGPVPTLIEWDQSLPTWQTLIAEAHKAKAIMKEVCNVAS